MEDKQRFVRDTLSHLYTLEDVAMFATTILYSEVPTEKVAVIEGDTLRAVSTIGRRVFMGLSLDRPSINARAVRTARTQLVNDTRLDPDYFPGDGADAHTMLSELCVPLVHGGRVLGTVNLESRQPGRFTEEDREAAEAFAAEVAGAVHRVMGDGQAGEGRLQPHQEAGARTALDRYRDILRAVDEGETVMNRILNRAAVQWKPGKQLIGDLAQKGYLERKRTTAKRHAYFITDEGQRALETYEEIARHFKQPPQTPRIKQPLNGSCR